MQICTAIDMLEWLYSGLSLKGDFLERALSRKDTPLERTQILGNKYYECM